jgi:regulatory protein YycI of two-component signal transduction system YycFG
MGRPDYDFSFFLTDDFFAGKKKNKNKNNSNKAQRGCEMNQLEMTVDESLQSKHRRPSVFSSNQKVSSQP